MIVIRRFSQIIIIQLIIKEINWVEERKILILPNTNEAVYDEVASSV